jgi:hypothetical protein
MTFLVCVKCAIFLNFTTKLTFYGLMITFHTTRLTIQKFYKMLTWHLCVLCVCVLYRSPNKQWLLLLYTSNRLMLYNQAGVCLLHSIHQVVT